MTFRAALVTLFLAGGMLEMRGQATPPQDTVRDPQTGIIYHIEADGRHVVAISPKEAVLWTRDCSPSPRETITHLTLADENECYLKAQKLSPRDYLDVSWGMAWGLIRKSDGKVIYLGSD